MVKEINIDYFINGVETRIAKLGRLVGHAAASNAGREGEAAAGNSWRAWRTLMWSPSGFCGLLRTEGMEVDGKKPATLGDETDALWNESAALPSSKQEPWPNIVPASLCKFGFPCMKSESVMPLAFAGACLALL